MPQISRGGRVAAVRDVTPVFPVYYFLSSRELTTPGYTRHSPRITGPLLPEKSGSGKNRGESVVNQVSVSGWARVNHPWFHEAKCLIKPVPSFPKNRDPEKTGGEFANRESFSGWARVNHPWFHEAKGLIKPVPS